MDKKDFDTGRAAILRMMMDRGASIETISRLTGLANSELEQLLNEDD